MATAGHHSSPSPPPSPPATTAIPRWRSSSRPASSPATGSSSATWPTCPTAGGYMTTTAGAQPVLVMRDEDGELRAFRNVCRHRGSRLLSGSGECGKAIRCRYHGWTYRLDGELIGVPEGRSIPGLDKSALGLFPARIEVMSGLVFVNLDVHAEPLADQVVGLPERLARYSLDRLAPVRRVGGHPALELEDRRRQLQRGLPRPDRASRADAAARLQALRRRGARRLDLVRGAAARQAVRQPDGARLPAAREADARAPRGGPARVALRVHLSEHDDRPLSRPGGDLADRLGRPAALARRGARVPASATPACAPGSRSSRTTRSTRSSGTRTSTSSQNVQAGLETRGFELGPLSHREAAIAWFADRVRADLG